MSTALTKAIRRTEAVATAAYNSGMRMKASGFSSEFSPTAPLSGMATWQEQQVYQERYALMREWVYAAINALASEGAGQPAVVARLSGSKNKPKGKKLLELKKMTESARRKTAEVEYEIQEEHPLVDLLERPNSFQQKWQFVYSFFANLVLTGWAYVVVSWNKQEKRLELFSLPSTWMKPIHEKGLFLEFEIKNPKAVAEPVPLDRSQVGFAMLPNPSDPLAALAPTSSQIRTLRMHEHMLNGQEAFFRNGIHPSAIVTMAQGPYQSIKGRPVLTRAQRRQIYQALRQNVMGDLNQGTAFIVDGLIESIQPFKLTNREMGWDKAEEKIKSRILSAFGVHSFILGEFMPGSQAQAETIEARFYKRVNTYLDMLGTLLTDLLGRIDGEERMQIWFEKCEAVNPERRDSTLLSMRASGDISQNELRAEMGFAPDEDLNQAVIQPQMMAGVGQVVDSFSSGAVQRDQAVAWLENQGLPTEQAERIVGKRKKEGSTKEDKRSMLLNSVGGMTGTVQVLTAVGQGVMGREEAANMLALFLQIPVDEALKMVPEPPPPPVEPPLPLETPLEPSRIPSEGDEEEEGLGTGEGEEASQGAVEGATEELKLANLLLAKALESPERQAERILRSVECR